MHCSIRNLKNEVAKSNFFTIVECPPLLDPPWNWSCDCFLGKEIDSNLSRDVTFFIIGLCPIQRITANFPTTWVISRVVAVKEYPQ